MVRTKASGKTGNYRANERKNSFRYCMQVICSNHLQLIAWKGALFCFSTDSVQFTENTLVNTYLHFVGEMGMNTSTQSPAFYSQFMQLLPQKHHVWHTGFTSIPYRSTVTSSPETQEDVYLKDCKTTHIYIHIHTHILLGDLTFKILFLTLTSKFVLKECVPE